MYRSLLSAVLSLSLLLSTLTVAHAASYTFTTFAVPGARYTAANGINTVGQVVGLFQDTQGENYGFLKDGDTYTIINVPDAVFTEPRGINDTGQIVGWFGDATVQHGFLKHGDMLTTFDVPGPAGINTGTKFTLPHSINNAGQIVGWFRDASGVDHGFLKEGETFTQIDPPNAIFTRAHGIDDNGQIVGWFRHTALVDHGFLKEGETFTAFDAPSSTLTVPYGINTAGQIVGYSSGDQGFLKEGDTFTTIAVPGGVDTKPYGINNAGQIVGTFQGTGGYQGFVATPEPTIPPERQLASLGPASLWIGLKNNDDQGTAFDLQAEVAITSVGESEPVATARTLCIMGMTRNPNKAKKAVIQFGPFLPVSVAPDAVFSLTIRTRIGTNPNGTKCAGHSNAVGLRLYYDSTSEPSQIGVQLTPEALRDFFLHSSSNVLFLDESDPTATTAKFKDSAGVNFAGGNPWKAIGTWSMTLP